MTTHDRELPTGGQFSSIQARPVIRSTHASDGNLRGSQEKMPEKTKEPKFFGTTAKPQQNTGVRCGGFQGFDWRPRETLATAAPPTKRTGGAQHQGQEDTTRTAHVERIKALQRADGASHSLYPSPN